GIFFFSSRSRHTRFSRDWSSDVCSSDLIPLPRMEPPAGVNPASDEEAGCPHLPCCRFRSGQRSAGFPVRQLHGGFGSASADGRRSEERRVGKAGRRGGERWLKETRREDA